ncbi:VOC family protein [Kitasatospora sp. NBC_00315]|uniref:VOC family protein n=1 Tax=Kitasatospora sp. NBC_00315 TaxID=2975963 RepID=UPI003245398A
MLSTDHVPGSPNWLDLAAADTTAAGAFYTSLFGWELASAGPAAGGYGFFRQDGRTVAALGPLTEDGASPTWTVYFATPDADRTTALVERAGGKVRFAPFDVFTNGRMAGFTDPTGADFAVWQPRDTLGLDAVNSPGALCWTECYSTDAEAAKTFYRAVFDWREQDLPFGDLTYTVLTPAGGGTDDVQGGIMQLGPEQTAAGTTSHWLPYFEVTDPDACAAAAERLGATVRIPPMDVHGIGRLAQVIDPGGAVLAVIRSAEPGR